MHGSARKKKKKKKRSILTTESCSSRNQIYGENTAESKQDKQGSVGRLLNTNFSCLLKGCHTGRPGPASEPQCHRVTRVLLKPVCRQTSAPSVCSQEPGVPGTPSDPWVPGASLPAPQRPQNVICGKNKTTTPGLPHKAVIFLDTPSPLEPPGSNKPGLIHP